MSPLFYLESCLFFTWIRAAATATDKRQPQHIDKRQTDTNGLKHRSCGSSAASGVGAVTPSNVSVLHCGDDSCVIHELPTIGSAGPVVTFVDGVRAVDLSDDDSRRGAPEGRELVRYMSHVFQAKPIFHKGIHCISACFGKYETAVRKYSRR